MRQYFLQSLLFSLFIFSNDLLAVSKIYTMSVTYDYGDYVPREVLCPDHQYHVPKRLTEDFQDSVIVEWVKNMLMIHKDFRLSSLVEHNNSCNMNRSHTILNEDTVAFSIGNNKIETQQLAKDVNEALNTIKKYHPFDPKIEVYLSEKFE